MSCLFRSLAIFINIGTDNLRQKICDFLEENPKLIDGKNNSLRVSDIVSEDFFLLYIKNMRNAETWGGGIEIKAFCEIYEYQVNVTIPNDKIISFYPKGLPVRIINISWTGNHFTSN